MITSSPNGDKPRAKSRQTGAINSALDPAQLRMHRAHCAAARSQLHGLRGAVEAVDAFLSPRFFSTLVVLAAGAALLLWLGA